MSELLEQLQEAHERWCYGSSDTLFVRAKIEIESLRQRLAAAEAAARWLWPKVSDDAYDAAWEKWPWLDSESAKGGRE